MPTITHQTDLHFPMQKVLRKLMVQIENATDPETRPTYEQKVDGITDPPPQFHMAKDQGIYLMTNLVEQPEDNIVYAEGFSTDDPQWHHHCSHAVGGDDFVTHIPIEWYDIAARNNHSDLTVRYTRHDDFSYRVALIA